MMAILLIIETEQASARPIGGHIPTWRIDMARVSVLCALVALTVGVLSPGKARSEGVQIRDGSYAAIAYSPSTKAFGYGYDYNSRSSAEQAALRNCPHADARVVTWVSGGFCALVESDDGSWGAAADWGVGSSNLRALDQARLEAEKHGKSHRVVLILSSDGSYIHRPARK